MIDKQSVRTTHLFVVVLILLMAGCVGPSSGPKEETSTPTVTSNGDNGTTPWYGVHYRPDVVESNESGFYFKTFVGFALPEDVNETFEDVMLCLYDEEGNVLNSKTLGTFQAPDDWQFNVTITAEERPKFIVVDHPKFREYSYMEMNIYTWEKDDDWEGGGVFRELPEKPDTMNNTLTFEYPRHDEPGRCM